MEQLIFFAVIIFFSILESIARSRKARQRGEEMQPEGEPREVEGRRRWEPPPRETLPTYDSEPSYDDRATAPARHRPASETMLPADLLEELAQLAQRRGEAGSKGQTVQRPRPSPRDAREDTSVERYRTPGGPGAKPRTPSPIRATPIGGSDLDRPDHRVHLSHQGFGTDPSERYRFEPRARTELPHPDPDVGAVRRQLRSRTASALRQAVILQEVLGPPVAMRDERGPSE